jgi:hypothetical protein
LLIGVALYWAEGSKEKANKPGAGVQFVNSDGTMIKLFLKWLSEIDTVTPERIKFTVAIHENSENRIGNVIKFWSQQTGFPKDKFTRIYYKKHNPKTKRKNVGSLYNGVLAITVNRSSDLNRKIAGWTQAINNIIAG